MSKTHTEKAQDLVREKFEKDCANPDNYVFNKSTMTISCNGWKLTALRDLTYNDEGVYFLSDEKHPLREQMIEYRKNCWDKFEADKLINLVFSTPDVETETPIKDNWWKRLVNWFRT